jgi:VIT1/CCC1 family predicted Fe2+/Mn2+ transporter
MKASLYKGLSFGLTSGIITTLGMIVGLHSFSGSRLVVLGGVLTIAIADAFSDALGVHISEESENKSAWDVWGATLATLASKMVFAMTFVIPIIFLEIETAIWASIAWGMSLLTILSYFIARHRKEKPIHVIGEHVLIAAFVIAITHLLGDWISGVFV